jgi:tetratricopeptide (TPR) repeat protein
MTPEQQNIFTSGLNRARALKAERKYDQAMELLQEILDEHPDNLKAKASLADLYYRTQHFRKAMTMAGEILSKNPDDPRALVVMGNVLLIRKKPKEALEFFKLAQTIAETDYLWLRQARAYLDSNEVQQALIVLDNAEALGSDGRELLRLKAECARLLSNQSMEKQVFKQAARIAPDEAHSFFLFVQPLLEDLPARRAAIISSGLRETPQQELNPFLLLFESESLLKSRDPKKAKARLKTLLAHDPPASISLEIEQLTQAIDQALSLK